MKDIVTVLIAGSAWIVVVYIETELYLVVHLIVWWSAYVLFFTLEEGFWSPSWLIFSDRIVAESYFYTIFTVLDKLKDFLPVMSEANKKLQLAAMVLLETWIMLWVVSLPAKNFYHCYGMIYAGQYEGIWYWIHWRRWFTTYWNGMYNIFFSCSIFAEVYLPYNVSYGCDYIGSDAGCCWPQYPWSYCCGRVCN